MVGFASAGCDWKVVQGRWENRRRGQKDHAFQYVKQQDDRALCHQGPPNVLLDVQLL